MTIGDSIVSVVIPAFNCETTIRQTIEAILQQRFSPRTHIIIVDDGSIDKTAEIVKSYPAVKYIYQKNSGPAAARNRGAQEAAGEYIFFTDADCVPQPEWMARMMPHFRNPEIGVVAGSYGIANPENLLANCIHAEILFRHQKLMPDFPKSFGSYNFCLRKEVFLKAGGFDPVYRFASGEDNDLSYKILKAGYKIYFEKTALVDHYHTEDMRQYFKEQYRHGFWRAKMYHDHLEMWRGDNYTFWKDIIEIPLALFSLLNLFVFLPFPVFVPAAARFSVFSLIFLEVFYGLRMLKGLRKGFFFAFVMLLRAFARTLGFFSGILHFTLPKSFKKSK